MSDVLTALDASRANVNRRGRVVGSLTSLGDDAVVVDEVVVEVVEVLVVVGI